jgi:hypothetical protein
MRCGGVAAVTISLLALVAAVAACNREPPPGAGAVETTGVKTSRAGSIAAPTLTAFPGGAVLVGDIANCTASRFEEGTKTAVWSVIVPLCDGVMETAVAPDSVSYVRTRRELVAIGVNGQESWRLTIGTEPLPETLLTPAVTLDSSVVVITGTRSIVAYKSDRSQPWRFGVAEDEVLVASPIGSRGEGVYLLTNRALYNLGADGALRFRRALKPPSGVEGR